MARLRAAVKPCFSGAVIANGGITPPAAQELVAGGSVDVIAFGRPFLANPDLPARIRGGGPFNEPRSIGWYGGSAEGYTDYPSLQSILGTSGSAPLQTPLALPFLLCTSF